MIANVPKYVYKRVVNGTSTSSTTNSLSSAVETSSYSTTAPLSLLVATTTTIDHQSVTISHQSTLTSTSSSQSFTTSTTIESSTTTSKHVTTASSPTITSFTTTSTKRAWHHRLCNPNRLKTDTAIKCRVNIPHINLHYWPTGTAAGNKTYPSTSVLTQYGHFTMYVTLYSHP